MEQNDYSIISQPLEKDFVSFCKLNNINNIEEFRFECFKKGYYIEKYGLLGEDDEIKPWEVVVEKEVVKEVVKEIEVGNKDCDEKLISLTQTLQTLRLDLTEKESKIKEQQIKIDELTTIFQNKVARFHPGSDISKRI
jgi:hypothetical protein